MNNEEYSRWLGGEKIEALLFRHNSIAEITLPDGTDKAGAIVAATANGPEPIYTLEADDGSGDIQCLESVLRVVDAEMSMPNRAAAGAGHGRFSSAPAAPEPRRQATGGAMNASPQLEYVKTQVEREIGLFKERKGFDRKAAFAFTVVPATLAALATVAIGASEKLGNQWLPILAMIATGIASILGAWEALFSNRKLWRIDNIALTGLYELKSDIEYREIATERSITPEETDQYFARLKAIRSEADQSYQHAVGNV